MPLTLAIETSQRIGSVALRDQTCAMHEEVLLSEKRHDDDLLPAIDRVFKRAGLTPRDLDATSLVAVSIGPGAFTGLRIAISTVKMIAEATGAKIAAVPSAHVVAEGTLPNAKGTLLVALAVKHETFWATVLRHNDEEWVMMSEPRLLHAEELDITSFEAVLGDEHLPQSMRAACERAGVPVVEPRFSAAACLRLGEKMAAREKWTDPLMLTPLYPREPEAVTLWAQRHGGQ